MERLLNASNYKPLFFSLLVLLSLSVFLTLYIPRALESYAEDQAISSAQMEVEKFRSLQTYYSKHIARKVASSSDLELSTQHNGHQNRLPVPFTFLIEVSKEYDNAMQNLAFYSPYPFKGRTRDTTPFDREAWNALNTEKEPYYVERKIIDGAMSVSIAIPQLMSAPSCVNCHNTHPDSVKKDWQQGQVRGIMKTTVSLAKAKQKGYEISRMVFTVLGVITLLASLLFILFIRRKKSEESLRQLALCDELTGLMNRHSFQATLSTLIDQKINFTLMYIDLDGFKLINDTYGHNAGDAVLAEVSKRIQMSVRQSDHAFRLGGDEFATILNGLDNEADAEAFAQRLLTNIPKNINFEGNALTVGCSIGLALSHLSPDDPDLLIQYADGAMYHSKKSGKQQYTIAQKTGP